jgi:hypothetical protein
MKCGPCISFGRGQLQMKMSVRISVDVLDRQMSREPVVTVGCWRIIWPSSAHLGSQLNCRLSEVDVLSAGFPLDASGLKSTSNWLFLRGPSSLNGAILPCRKMSSPAESATASALISDVLCRGRHQFFCRPQLSPRRETSRSLPVAVACDVQEWQPSPFGSCIDWCSCCRHPLATTPVLLIPAKRVTDR